MSSRKPTYTQATGMPDRAFASLTVITALRMAYRYRDRNPSREQVMKDYGVSRATAYRWIAAMSHARQMEGERIPDDKTIWMAG